MALDLTLYDTTTGQELDMGTGFDSFDRLAWPRHEAEFLASGRLSREQHENRLILRKFMEAQGFTQLYFEWWQFDLHMPGGIPAMFKWFE
jgi:D-alanyl-D-alanine dipeptidase